MRASGLCFWRDDDDVVGRRGPPGWTKRTPAAHRNVAEGQRAPLSPEAYFLSRDLPFSFYLFLCFLIPQFPDFSTSTFLPLLEKLLDHIDKIRSNLIIPHLVHNFCRLASTVTLRFPRIPALRLTAWMASLVALRNLVAIFSLPFLLGCSPSSVSLTGS